MEMMLRVSDTLKSFRETRLSAFRSPVEFFDYQRISRPADLSTATSRMSYNTKYFSGNYSLIVAVLAVYALLTNYLLIIAVVFLFGGWFAIGRFVAEPLQFGDYTITQKNLYIALFVIGLPLLWVSAPFSTFFWLVGASGFLILGHAALLEPGIESEYAAVQEQV